MSDKKVSAKKINIKNIKEAAKTLNKKNTPNTKKAPKKNVKKQTKRIVKNESVNNEKLSEQVVLEKKKPISVKVSKDKSLEKNKKIAKKNKKEEKAKLIIPKEWKNINVQSKNKGKQEENISLTKKLSIFEEVDEKTLAIEKEKNKKLIKKTILIVASVVAIVFLTVFILIKYNKYVKEKLYIYQVYSIGDKVELKDSSIWYVVNDSAANESTIKLLRDKPLDINNDGKLDDEDKRIYNANNEALYDNSDDNSIGKYLQDTYRLELQKTVGKLDEVTLLSSKEFVKIREKMGFGYEWSEGNWLADPSFGYWWVISNQNEKVYAVGPTGVYKIYSADSYNFVRPVIVIGKEMVKKNDEKQIKDIETDNETNEFENNEVLPGIKNIIGK